MTSLSLITAAGMKGRRRATVLQRGGGSRGRGVTHPAGVSFTAQKK